MNLVAALVPILILPGASFYFDVIPKVVVLLLGAALAAKSLVRDRFSALLAALAGAAILAAIFSTHPGMSFYGSTWRKSGVIAELAVLALAASVRSIHRYVLLASIPVAIYGILQYFGIDPILNAAGYHSGPIVRPPSTMGHAAYLATYLLFIVFAASAEKVRWRWIPISLGIAAIVLSGTRAAVLGLVIGLIVLRVNWRWMAGAIALFAIFYISPAGEKMRARVHWASEDALGGARRMLWRDSLKMAAHRPLLGYGPETFSVEFLKHESIDLERAYPDFYHESPHNIFVDALVSKGIVGLIPLAAIAILGLLHARGAMGAAFIAMLVSQQFTTFTLPTEFFFFVCAGLLLRDQSAPPLRISPLLAIPFAAFAVYLAAGDALLASGKRALDRGDLAAAINRVNQARAWHASADIYFSRRFSGIADLRAYPAAMTAAMQAPQTADDPQNALVNLAGLQAIANDVRGVEQSLRRAIHVAPQWYKPYWLLAEVLAREGRLQEARDAAFAAIDRDGGKHPEVKATWDRLR